LIPVTRAYFTSHFLVQSKIQRIRSSKLIPYILNKTTDGHYPQ